ncbi:hypothetical protein SEA_BENCZKOWSKI14_25 [Gordonia phage Benczkowski14]|uniref:Tail assembly chaperone n=3 Tax=Demosthenesvirus katyusha TaxID=1982108 RepID=A0A142KCA2_9CAUD|nr:tail assembly chaperone [Gordonia phage Kvothe]YP_009603298.1 tail assembly chaperone [Gordonia phage Katyusha]AMS03735.1 hypothetical protein SEA_BENCZKOWSKI14_25 [Gordonia phage Benczkowski14]UJD20663.1 tail assembly chaperone [Gordonia phage Niagara]AMS03418.1 tail assembly chaperone [Gordonia phage Katyusha]ANA86090.1 tail assembly chaperone [Gordonia phage Kvothe]
MTVPVPTSQADRTAFDPEDDKTQRTIDRMAEAGEVIEEKRFVDYFAEPETHLHKLPDGVQWFEFQELREGGKAKYEKIINREGIKVQRATGDARLPIDPAIARHTLIQLAVTNAYIITTQNGRPEPLQFRMGPNEKNTRFWETVLEKFPSNLIDELHKEVQKVNRWIAADDDIEGLEKQRDELEERIRMAREEEAKKGLLIEQAEDFVRGRQVQDPHPILLIYQRLETWNWNLPYVQGGLADQDVMLLRGIDIIASAKARFEREEQKRQEAATKTKNPTASKGTRPAGRRGRRR